MRKFFFISVMFFFSILCSANSTDKMKGRWSKEKAWEWYNSQNWIRGFNGYPSNCVNRIAMWQEFKHKDVFEQIEKEFQLAKETGFNAVRTIIQFEVWYYEHDSFMANLEEYFMLADKYGLQVMLTLGNDCTVPKSRWKPVKFGEQPVDWGYHSGTKTGPHTGDYSEAGYQLLDDPDFEHYYYKMVEELARKYAKDARLHLWNVWNEIGNSNRGNMSVPAMEKCFSILRAHNPIQPLTADCWRYKDGVPYTEAEKRACELSDIITFHYYGPYENMIEIIEKLRQEYDRPLINSEWLHRIRGNNVAEIFPLFYLENIGSYHWGLIAGFSQTYEPAGYYYQEYLKEGSTLDMSKWQHDLYRFNWLPYDPKEIKTIKRFTKMADERFIRKQTQKKDLKE